MSTKPDSEDSGVPNEKPTISPWSPEYRNRPFSWKAFLAVVCTLAAGLGLPKLLADGSGYYIAMLFAAIVAMLIVAQNKFRE